MNKYLISILALIVIISCESKVQVYKDNKGEFAELEVKIIKNESYYISINFNNTTNDTIGIICIGELRKKGDYNDVLYTILYDVIIEIKQGDSIIRSDEIKFRDVYLYNCMHELLIIDPNSELNFPILYNGDLVEDFKLENSSFLIRLILEPLNTHIDKILAEIEKELMNKHKNIKLIKTKIITPFLKVNP